MSKYLTVLLILVCPNRAQIASPLVDQRRFRPPERVSAKLQRVEPDAREPF